MLWFFVNCERPAVAAVTNCALCVRVCRMAHASSTAHTTRRSTDFLLGWFLDHGLPLWFAVIRKTTLTAIWFATQILSAAYRNRKTETISLLVRMQWNLNDSFSISQLVCRDDTRIRVWIWKIKKSFSIEFLLHFIEEFRRLNANILWCLPCRLRQMEGECVHAAIKILNRDAFTRMHIIYELFDT